MYEPLNDDRLALLVGGAELEAADGVAESPSPMKSAFVGSQVRCAPGSSSSVMVARIFRESTLGSVPSSTAPGAMYAIQPSTPFSAVALAKSRSACIRGGGSRSAAKALIADKQQQDT